MSIHSSSQYSAVLNTVVVLVLWGGGYKAVRIDRTMHPLPRTFLVVVVVVLFL